MNAYKYHYRHRQSGDAPIVVIPSAPQYVEQMAACHQAAYGYSAADADGCDECLTAEKYLQHLAIFPEGQFIALDTAADRVVGVTTSLRMNLDIARPFLGSWTESTGGG